MLAPSILDASPAASQVIASWARSWARRARSASPRPASAERHQRWIVVSHSGSEVSSSTRAASPRASASPASSARPAACSQAALAPAESLARWWAWALSTSSRARRPAPAPAADAASRA
ncbi:MAG: hypothetical protein ACRD03_03760, partial [Acidimicrobiales bacterium]